MALSHLEQHCVVGLPRLADVMPHLFERDVASVPARVARFQMRHGVDLPLPVCARLNGRLPTPNEQTDKITQTLPVVGEGEHRPPPSGLPGLPCGTIKGILLNDWCHLPV